MKKAKMRKKKELLVERNINIKVDIIFKPHIKINNSNINGCISYPNCSIIPTVRRYFFIPSSDILLSNSTVINSNQFTNDDGNVTTEFMDFGLNGYFNLYLNGVIQEGNLYKVDSHSLTFQPIGQTIFAGTPIIVESVGFSVGLI